MLAKYVLFIILSDLSIFDLINIILIYNKDYYRKVREYIFNNLKRFVEPEIWQDTLDINKIMKLYKTMPIIGNVYRICNVHNLDYVISLSQKKKENIFFLTPCKLRGEKIVTRKRLDQTDKYKQALIYHQSQSNFLTRLGKEKYYGDICFLPLKIYEKNIYYIPLEMFHYMIINFWRYYKILQMIGNYTDNNEINHIIYKMNDSDFIEVINKRYFFINSLRNLYRCYQLNLQIDAKYFNLEFLFSYKSYKKRDMLKKYMHIIPEDMLIKHAFHHLDREKGDILELLIYAFRPELYKKHAEKFSFI
jgi:hypothetical protein